MSNTKIILLGNSTMFDDLYELSCDLIKEHNLEFSKIFTNDTQKVKENSNIMFDLDLKTINEAYKNNSLLCVKSVENISEGILFDDFETKDLFILNVDLYNMISTWIFEHYNILTIWIDRKMTEADENNDTSIRYLMERFDMGAKYMYFLNESHSKILSTISKYLNGTDQEKNLLLVENS